MKIFDKVPRRLRIGAVGFVGCAVLISLTVAQAQDATVLALSDRAQIHDLITRYYYNFGHSSPEDFSHFYARGAEMILGTTPFKGRRAIAELYARAGKAGPSSKAYSFNVTISNPLIVVHGNTATAELIFTEFVIQKKGEAPRIRTQGREYSTLVKVNGEWLYKTREIEGGSEPPKGWKP